MTEPTKKTKFLIIRFSAYGDVVQTLSVPSAIIKTFPDAEIHWVTRKDMSPLIIEHPHVRKVWSFDRGDGILGLLKLGRQLRFEQFTHIYDAHNNLRSRVLSFILRPKGPFQNNSQFIRRSIRRWKRFLLFQMRINLFEMPFSGQRDLLEPLKKWGISKVSPPPPQLFLKSEDIKAAECLLGDFVGGVALAPSAAHSLKRWPKEYWKNLILSLPDSKFILLGGPQDTFLDEIRSVAPERVLDLSQKSSLAISASTVFLSRLLITNDTWLLHVAEQIGKKAIALMGPAPFGFPSRPTTHVMELKLPCRPCSKHGQGPCKNKNKYHQCLVDIKPEDVAIEARVNLSSSL